MLLIYFVGHGVLSDRGELCLAIKSTEFSDPDVTGVEYQRVRDVLVHSPAQMKVTILDCCYSGRAIEALSSAQAIADSTFTQGAYTLTASDQAAHVPPLAAQLTGLTSFTDEFVKLIRAGVPGGPQNLALHEIYIHLLLRLKARGLPSPNQRGTDTADRFIFTRNAAWPPPVHRPRDGPLRHTHTESPATSQTVGGSPERVGARRGQATTAAGPATPPSTWQAVGKQTTVRQIPRPRAPAKRRPPGNGGVTAFTDADLRRDIGRGGMLWSSTGSIISAGWLFGGLYAATAAGTAAFLSWIIGGVAVLILSLVHSELGAMYPLAGGTARYPQLAFGNVAGIAFGWFSWLQAATIAPFEVAATERFASFYWHGLLNPSSGQLTGLGYAAGLTLLGTFTLLNLLGIQRIIVMNNAFTWGKILIPGLLVIYLLAHMHVGNFDAGGFMPYGIKGVLSGLSSAGVIYAYLGFEQAAQFGGESRNPQRDIPWAIIGSIIIAIVFYLLMQFIFIGALPPNQLTHGFGALSSSAIIRNSFGITGLVGFGALAVTMRIYAFMSPMGTALIYTSSTTRISYGLARDRYVPAIFSRTNGSGVPWAGLILAFVVGVFFLLPSATWQQLLGILTSASTLMYAGAPLAAGSLRRNGPHLHRPYQMPVAKVLAPTAFIVANLIIYWSGWGTTWRLGIAIAIGFFVVALTWLFSEQLRPEKLEWKPATWLPVYLIGMGAISRLGSFDGGSGRLRFGWDILAVATFSLIVYSWAMAVHPSLNAPQEWHMSRDS